MWNDFLGSFRDPERLFRIHNTVSGPKIYSWIFTGKELEDLAIHFLVFIHGWIFQPES
jgi:hypothetical protein